MELQNNELQKMIKSYIDYTSNMKDKISIYEDLNKNDLKKIEDLDNTKSSAIAKKIKSIKNKIEKRNEEIDNLKNNNQYKVLETRIKDEIINNYIKEKTEKGISFDINDTDYKYLFSEFDIFESDIKKTEDSINENKNNEVAYKTVTCKKYINIENGKGMVGNLDNQNIIIPRISAICEYKYPVSNTRRPYVSGQKRKMDDYLDSSKLSRDNFSTFAASSKNEKNVSTFKLSREIFSTGK